MEGSIILVVTIFAVGILAGLNLFQFMNYRQREKSLSMTMKRMRKDMQALCVGAASMGNHVNALELKLRRLMERQEQLGNDSPGQHSYDHAIKMVQKGADLNSLLESCGLAQGEAELLLRMHGSKKR